MNKHEISAWWRFAFSGLYGAYLFWWLYFVVKRPMSAGLIHITDSFFIFAMLLLLSALYLRRRKGIDLDERDRAISATAAEIALMGIFVIVGLTPVVLFRMILDVEGSVTLELYWFDFYANACITLMIWLEAAVTVFHHWRDRR